MSISGLGSLLEAGKKRMIESGCSDKEAERTRLLFLRKVSMALPFSYQQEALKTINEKLRLLEEQR